ncbi:DUF4345 family protein [Qipengyuania spongiae]|uniref:DUF4345 domain-containing protein n=1 Tax=Qipengyuania spongiae TaxID=2909673 RepID=A0ABY5SXX6_9SPHN|nr:hypothetical protein [Qipengyuania spongiae]UVI39383.1 hypothetical protein L1F33_14325 [Qipengyuania spongiae]
MILRAIIILLALFDMIVGAAFFFTPGGSGRDFGLKADGAAGLSTLRADLTAFFVVSALCMAWGAWRRRADALLAPLALFAIAFTGRLANLVVAGTYERWWEPMAVEMFHIAVLGLAVRTWRWGPHSV